MRLGAALVPWIKGKSLMTLYDFTLGEHTLFATIS